MQACKEAEALTRTLFAELVSELNPGAILQFLELSGRLEEFGSDMEKRIGFAEAKVESLSDFLPSFLQQLKSLLEHDNAPQHLIDLVKCNSTRIDDILSHSNECTSAGKHKKRMSQQCEGMDV